MEINEDAMNDQIFKAYGWYTDAWQQTLSIFLRSFYEVMLATANGSAFVKQDSKTRKAWIVIKFLRT